MSVLSTPPGVLPMVECVVLMQRGTRFDASTGQARVPVEVVLNGGQTVRTDLIIDGPRLCSASVQLERAMAARDRAQGLAAS